MIYIANYNNFTKKIYQSLNAIECTIIFVIPSLANTNKLDGLPLENMPRITDRVKNIGARKNKPKTDIVWS